MCRASEDVIFLIPFHHTGLMSNSFTASAIKFWHALPLSKKLKVILHLNEKFRNTI